MRKGTWAEERIIGSGGFGTVNLWRNEETGEKIALKRCRLMNEMTPKQKQRWQLEVQIMQRLNHENVVSAQEVPEPLDVCPPELPLLAMEYCSGGDLRKMLNLPQHCCGLKEFNVRCLVQDVAAAVEYLHKNRIIHRDLKPENIVLKPEEDRTVYKVIDLGYAKDLDQGSVCTSFVGTLQYLAPELINAQKYTCTVDYWSMGTLVFECITGYRPFLPNSPPVQWHKEVCKKSPEDICAKIDDFGDVKFYKTIPTANRLSRSMKTYMEQWLQLMLRWDPKTRGGMFNNTSRPRAFTMLDQILDMKIIYMLIVASNDLLTFPVLDSHTLSSLQGRIEADTHIPEGEQDIVMATGLKPDPSKPAAQCWLKPSEEECYVYLFRRGGSDLNPENMKHKNKMPPAVQAIVKDPATIIPSNEQKRAWQESVLYCEEQHLTFKRLILSQRAAMLALLRTDSEFMKLKKKMLSDVEQLMAKVDFFQQSLDYDMEHYNEQATNGGVTSEKMYSKWLKLKDDVNKFKALREQVYEIEQKSVSVQTRILELQKSPFARQNKDDALEDLSKHAKRVYQEFRQVTKDNREPVRDQKDMATMVVKCCMWRDKKVPELFAHLKKIAQCKAVLEELLPLVDRNLEEILTASGKLISYQKLRQEAVWKLVQAGIQQGKKVLINTPPGNDEVDMRICRGDAPTTLGLHGSAGNLSLTSEGGGTQGSGLSLSQKNGGMLLQSIMNVSGSMDSIKAMEETKLQNKMFEDAMNELMTEQDDFVTKFTSIAIDASPYGSGLSNS